MSRHPRGCCRRARTRRSAATSSVVGPVDAEAFGEVGSLVDVDLTEREGLVVLATLQHLGDEALHAAASTVDLEKKKTSCGAPEPRQLRRAHRSWNWRPRQALCSLRDRDNVARGMASWTRSAPALRSRLSAYSMRVRTSLFSQAGSSHCAPEPCILDVEFQQDIEDAVVDLADKPRSIRQKVHRVPPTTPLIGRRPGLALAG